MTLAVLRSPAEWAAHFGDVARRSVVTVGNFDGVHLGHQEILRRVVERAHRDNAIAAVVTFDPHPLRVLRPADAPQLLLTIDQRLAAFEAAGIDAALVLPFDAALAKLTPEEFARRILVDTTRARAVLVGENFRFGHKQAGDVAQLRRFGNSWGFDVESIEPVFWRGLLVSSTTIRNAIVAGKLIRAGRLLGRPFALAGEIRTGTGLGRKYVVPTLNLQTPQRLLPHIGVYATETIVGGELYRSVSNVGLRPTFDGSGVTIESYLFVFNEERTSGPLEVRFWHRLRDEIKFSGPQALRAQIERDAARAQRYFRIFDSAHRKSKNAANRPTR